MNRDELLTKLAMEHAPDEWGDAATWTYDEHQFGWNEYQLRRTELINRPSWDDAPEWAQWLAQDGDCDWYWYESKPEALPKEGYFDADGRLESVATGIEVAGHNWRDTLEPRPQTQSDIKTCRHCNTSFRRPHLDSIPDYRCTRCDDEIKALWTEREPTTTRWTSKTCTECGHAVAAKVSDDKPVCSGCVAPGPDISGGGPDISDEGASLNQVLDDHMRMASEKWARGDMEARSKYHREIKPGVWVDVYDVLRAWGVNNPALQHLIKKALAPGERGHKTLEQDMNDIVASAKRAKELEE